MLGEKLRDSRENTPKNLLWTVIWNWTYMWEILLITSYWDSFSVKMWGTKNADLRYGLFHVLTENESCHDVKSKFIVVPSCPRSDAPSNEVSQGAKTSVSSHPRYDVLSNEKDESFF